MTMEPKPALATDTEPVPCGAEIEQLCAADFQVLDQPFLEAISFLFPPGLDLAFTAKSTDESAAENQGHHLYLPLKLAEKSEIYLQLRNTDATLLEEISPQWLEEQAEAVLHLLTMIRPGFIDCPTGFYNLRALPHALAKRQGIFFLLHLGCIRKNISETLRSCAESAALLRQHMDAPLFSLGFGLFAVLRQEEDRTSARRSAYLLQRRLRQEGLARCQIICLETAQAGIMYTESGLAGFQDFLSSVDKQGPFGMLCARGASERRTERFRLASNEVFRALQQEWRGQKAFTLALFRLEYGEDLEEQSTADFSAESLPWGALREHGPCWLVDPHTLVCFFAGILPPECTKKTEAIRALLRQSLPDTSGISIAMGIAGWPCLDYAKKQVPSNCLKALLHASLLGPGHTVNFDQLSLNVSGDSFFEEGNYQQAIREYRRGLRLKPDDVNLLNSLGATLAAYGQESQAAVSFRQALNLDPANHMALANLGYILLGMGKHEEAFKCLQEAHAAFPASETPPRELLQPLARLYLERNLHRQALDILKQWDTTAALPKDALYYRQLGLALEGCGETGKAMQAFEQALKRAPQDAIAMGHLGGLYQLSGEGEDLGLHFCEQAIRLERNHPSLWRILGKNHLKRGNLEAAEEAIGKCLLLDRTDGEGMWIAAQISLQKKNTRRARSWLNRASKLHTISEACKNDIARTLAELDRVSRKGAPSTTASKTNAPLAVHKPGR